MHSAENSSTANAGNHLRCRLRRRIDACRREDGQGLVELALVLPVLLVVVIAIVDFGRAVNYWNDENHLAEVGARYAAVGVPPTAGQCSGSSTLVSYLQCQAGVDSPELQNGSGRSSDGIQGGVTVSVCYPTNAVGQPVTVTVKAPFTWLKLPKVGGGSYQIAQSQLVGTATMRLENQIANSWFPASSC